MTHTAVLAVPTEHPTPYGIFNRMPLNDQWRAGRSGRELEDRDCAMPNQPQARP